jgi:hypothetical protein
MVKLDRGRPWFWLGFAAGGIEISILFAAAFGRWNELPWPVLALTGLLGPLGALTMFAAGFIVPQWLPGTGEYMFGPWYWILAWGVGAASNGMIYLGAARMALRLRKKSRIGAIVFFALLAAYLVAGYLQLLLAEIGGGRIGGMSVEAWGLTVAILTLGVTLASLVLYSKDRSATAPRLCIEVLPDDPMSDESKGAEYLGQAWAVQGGVRYLRVNVENLSQRADTILGCYLANPDRERMSGPARMTLQEREKTAFFTPWPHVLETHTEAIIVHSTRCGEIRKPIRAGPVTAAKRG